MTYQFHPEAEQELFDAIDYYEQREKDLGYDFSNEVHSAIQRIQAHPRAWPFIAENIRRALLKRFPYGILSLQQAGRPSVHRRRHALAQGTRILAGSLLSYLFYVHLTGSA